MSNIPDCNPPGPTPDSKRFWTLRRSWEHLTKYRESYLFPIIAIIVLTLAIHFVRYLTGRAVIDDPGAIIAALYNAVIVVIGIAILGGLQGHQIPDIDEDKIICAITTAPERPWHVNISLALVHLTNVVCTTVVFYLILRALFTGFSLASS